MSQKPCAVWSSRPGVLHRMMAEPEFTRLEVSAPEFDDVVRWQEEETGRRHGRIVVEREPRPIDWTVHFRASRRTSALRGVQRPVTMPNRSD